MSKAARGARFLFSKFCLYIRALSQSRSLAPARCISFRKEISLQNAFSGCGTTPFFIRFTSTPMIARCEAGGTEAAGRENGAPVGSKKSPRQLNFEEEPPDE